MVEIQVAIDGERKDPEGRKKAKRRIGEEKARIVKKCDGDYLLCAGNVQTEKKPGQEQKESKILSGMWLEILGQEKENHGSWSSEMSIQFQWAWKACIVDMRAGWEDIGGVDVVGQETIYSSTKSMVKLKRGIQSWERKKKKRKPKGGISGFLATQKVTVLFSQEIGGVSTTIQYAVCQTRSMQWWSGLLAPLMASTGDSSTSGDGIKRPDLCDGHDGRRPEWGKFPESSSGVRPA